MKMKLILSRRHCDFHAQSLKDSFPCALKVFTLTHILYFYKFLFDLSFVSWLIQL